MGLPEVRAELKLLRDQYAATEDAIDVKRELAENLLPLFDLLCAAIASDQDEIRDELGDIGAAVDDLIDDTGDVLTPETTTKIVGVLEVGKLLTKELVALLPKLDDVGKKRVAALVKTYRTGTEVVIALLTEITLPVEPEIVETEPVSGVEDDEDEDEEDDDLEGDDEDEDDEGDGEDEEDGTIVGGV